MTVINQDTCIRHPATSPNVFKTHFVCNMSRYLFYELYNLSWVVFLLFLLQKDDFQELGKMFRQYVAREGDPFILDIDLDFFSTRNPFRGLYENADLYSHLQELYNFQRPEDEQDPKVGSILFHANTKYQKAVTTKFPGREFLFVRSSTARVG